MHSKTIALAGVALCGLALAAAAPAFVPAPIPVEATAPVADQDEAVNTICPIAKEPIDGKTFVTHNGNKVGFCCPGCNKAFMKWSEKRRDDYVALAMRGGEMDDAAAAAAPPTKETAKPTPYLLDVCPVSGEKLGTMGDPIVKVIAGREVRFCCAGCVRPYEKDPAKFQEKIDALTAKQQKMFYPMQTCVVTDEPLVEDGKDIAIDLIHDNRLVRLCCRGCIKQFKADPAKHLKKLDAAIVKQQRSIYPLKDCAVMKGSALGSMGDPVEIVVANRLVKFCCAGCKPKFDKDPAKYIARIDAAWMAMHEQQGSGTGGEHGHGHHEHGGHGGHGGGR